jgi:hypothetical protein
MAFSAKSNFWKIAFLTHHILLTLIIPLSIYRIHCTVRKMPPKIDLEPYKDEILSWVSEKHTIPKILSKIIGILQVEYSLNILKRTLQEWGVLCNRKNRSPEVERIKLHISELFAGNYNNDMILQVLSVEGMPLYRRQLVRYRLDLGLIRRMTIEERDQKY